MQHVSRDELQGTHVIDRHQGHEHRYGQFQWKTKHWKTRCHNHGETLSQVINIYSWEGTHPFLVYKYNSWEPPVFSGQVLVCLQTRSCRETVDVSRQTNKQYYSFVDGSSSNDTSEENVAIPNVPVSSLWACLSIVCQLLLSLMSI